MSQTQHTDESHDRRAWHEVLGSVTALLTGTFIAFEAGALSHQIGLPWSAWSWDSPWGRVAVIGAALWAGIVVAALVLSRWRNREADEVARRVDAAYERACALEAESEALVEALRTAKHPAGRTGSAAREGRD